jgi:hypothetical protein
MKKTTTKKTKSDRKIIDPAWRIRNLYKIVNKDGKVVKFTPNEFQERVLDDPARHKAILKARQIGFSTACIIRLLDKTMFTDNQTSVILAHEKDSITKLFRIVLRAYKYMDKRYKPRIDRGGGSKHELYFPDINSRIYCDLESRGDTIQNLHISEFGLMKDDSKVRATVDAVPLHTGEITYESTPFGLNHFYDLWFMENHPAKKFFFPWYLFKEYALPTKAIEYTEDELELIEKALKEHNVSVTKEQIAFRRWKISQKGGGINGLRDFIQEYPEDERSCFLTSGNAVFNLFHIQRLIKNAPKPIRTLPGGIKIYKEFDKTKLYVAGADCAEGVGGDKSAGIVLQADTLEIVASCVADVKPYEFASLLVDMCGQYAKAGRPWPCLAVERNNHGHAVLLQLKEHEQYPNLYYRVTGQDDNGRDIMDERPGWVTDKITRPIMIDGFISAVDNNYIKLNDGTVLNECLTLVNNEGKIEAAEGKHDDTIIASSIALQVALKMRGNLSVYNNLASKIKM